MKNLKPYILLTAIASIFSFKVSAQAIPGMMADCHPAEIYKFDGSMSMKMKTFGSTNDTINITSKMYLSSAGKYMGINMQGVAGLGEGGMNMIMDLKDSITYMLMNIGEQKQGMCMDMNSPMMKSRIKEMKGDSSYDFNKYKKTGNTKKILGYTCDEYKYEDKNKTQSFWMTPEGGDWWKIYNQAWQADNSIALPKGFEGMLLAFEMNSKKEKTQMEMVVTEIKKDTPSEMSTKDYFTK